MLENGTDLHEITHLIIDEVRFLNQRAKMLSILRQSWLIRSHSNRFTNVALTATSY